MRAKQIYLWAVAVFAASVLSFVVGFMGWIFNKSGLPPFGGGIVKLIVVPVALTWLLVLGTVLIRERVRVRKESEEAASKRSLENLQRVIERDEGR